MTEPKIFSKTEALQMVDKATKNLINRIFDPNNEANRIANKAKNEWMEKEITRRVKEALTTERQAFKEKMDSLTINSDDLTGMTERIKTSYDAMMLELRKLEERNQNTEKVCETMITLTANVSGLTGSLDKIINLLEKKSKTNRDVVA